MQDTFELKKLHSSNNDDDDLKVFCTPEHSIQCSFTYCYCCDSPSFVLASSPVYSFVWGRILFAPLRRDTRPFTSRVARQQQRNDEMKRYKPNMKQRNETRRSGTKQHEETKRRRGIKRQEDTRPKRNKERQKNIFKRTTRRINKTIQLETEQRETQGE